MLFDLLSVVSSHSWESGTRWVSYIHSQALYDLRAYTILVQFRWIRPRHFLIQISLYSNFPVLAGVNPPILLVKLQGNFHEDQQVAFAAASRYLPITQCWLFSVGFHPECCWLASPSYSATVSGFYCLYFAPIPRHYLNVALPDMPLPCLSK